MANTRERVKDFPSIVGTIQSDDYIPVDGATQGVRKAQVKDIMDAPITGLDTLANTTKGAINELATTAGKVWVGTQAEYDDLPDTKLSDNVLHCITDGEPSAYDSIWDKVGTEPLDTTASDCSGAINEIKSSLSDSVTLSLNQASGKISAISGSAYRQGKVIFVSIDLTMNAAEGSNWIELGTISPAPPKNIRQNILSDTNMSGATVIRTQIDATTGKIKIFFGGSNSYSINMMYMTS